MERAEGTSEPVGWTGGVGPGRCLSSTVPQFFQFTHIFIVEVVAGIPLGPRDVRQMRHGLCHYFTVLGLHLTSCGAHSDLLHVPEPLLSVSTAHCHLSALLYFLWHVITIAYLTKCLPFPRITFIRTGIAVFILLTVVFTKYIRGAQLISVE